VHTPCAPPCQYSNYRARNPMSSSAKFKPVTTSRPTPTTPLPVSGPTGELGSPSPQSARTRPCPDAPRTTVRRLSWADALASGDGHARAVGHTLVTSWLYVTSCAFPDLQHPGLTPSPSAHGARPLHMQARGAVHSRAPVRHVPGDGWFGLARRRAPNAGSVRCRVVAVEWMAAVTGWVTRRGRRGRMCLIGTPRRYGTSPASVGHPHRTTPAGAAARGSA
jgi:hypothetical protein